MGEREAQVAGGGELSCLYGAFNNGLEQILVKRRMPGGDGSDTGGVGVDAPNPIACFSEATGSHTPDAPQTNDSDAVLHYLV
jgi:hypothetical protein